MCVRPLLLQLRNPLIKVYERLDHPYWLGTGRLINSPTSIGLVDTSTVELPLLSKR